MPTSAKGGMAAKDGGKRFSVIIVHRNGAAILLDALASLARAVDPGLDEVFLVDNGSSDDSLVRVRAGHPEVAILANPCNNGFSRANNQAIARASGRYLLLLNSDTQVPPDILDRLQRHFEARPDAGIIGASLIGADGAAQNSSHDFPTFRGELGLSARGRRARAAADGAGLREADWVVGACMAARGEALLQAGPLDEDFFFYYEDVEWCLRMRRHGWRVFVAADVPVVHLRGMSTRSIRKEALIEMLRSRLLFYRKAFTPLQFATLAAHRCLRLLFSGLFWGALTTALLWRVPRLHLRAQRYIHPLWWLLSGMPEREGLPDKCPGRRPAGGGDGR